LALLGLLKDLLHPLVLLDLLILEYLVGPLYLVLLPDQQLQSLPLGQQDPMGLLNRSNLAHLPDPQLQLRPLGQPDPQDLLNRSNLVHLPDLQLL
jgi:hypothetical protein